MNREILVTRSSMPDFTEYCDEIRDMWDSHWLTNMGVKHRELQDKLSEYLDVSELELLTNGHMAIEMTIQAMGLTGEIITTPFTFASTTHAIVRCGLKPVFCDINPVDFTIDVDQIEQHITEKTTAILPVHVYGYVCDVERIEAIAKRYNLKVIYDAAHAFGVRYKKRGIGNYGDASCFSFHATKVFNTVEGGAVSYSDVDLGSKIEKIKNFGITGPEAVEMVGGNAKMDEFRAAMGLCNLRHIDNEIEKRAKVVGRYRERLDGVQGIQLNALQKDVVTNYAYFPVLFDPEEFGVDRDMVMAKLDQNCVKARKYFYPLVSQYGCYEGMFDPKETPAAMTVSSRVLTLPLYGDLPLVDVDRICDIVLGCGK